MIASKLNELSSQMGSMIIHHNKAIFPSRTIFGEGMEMMNSMIANFIICIAVFSCLDDILGG
jgi:hypothetical protein